MLLPRALLVPHLPTLLEDELRGHRTPMIEALAREARRFQAERPEIAVVLSGARFESRGPFAVGSARFHRTLTDDPAFGVEARYDCEGHPELARALLTAGERASVRVGPTERGIDSGVSVPLHFLAPARSLRVVPLWAAPRPVPECRSWGATIRRTLEGRPERIGFVVGGMLSYGTHAWTFRREVREARELDELLLTALGAGDWEALAPAAERWQERAHPEAGLRHLQILRGFLGADLAAQIACYEAAPGMGSLLAAFEVTGTVSVAPPEPRAPEQAHVPTRRVPATGRERRAKRGSSAERRAGARDENRASRARPRPASAARRTPKPRGRAPTSRPTRRRRG